jgi:hypothetical protein
LGYPAKAGATSISAEESAFTEDLTTEWTTAETFENASAKD